MYNIYIIIILYTLILEVQFKHIPLYSIPFKISSLFLIPKLIQIDPWNSCTKTTPHRPPPSLLQKDLPLRPSSCSGAVPAADWNITIFSRCFLYNMYIYIYSICFFQPAIFFQFTWQIVKDIVRTGPWMKTTGHSKVPIPASPKRHFSNRSRPQKEIPAATPWENCGWNTPRQPADCYQLRGH